MSPIQNWYPSRIRMNPQLGVYCEWMHLQDMPFTDPFFDETLVKARRIPANSSRFRPTSGLDMLTGWSVHLPHVPPTAFIFHVSRCGSTLLSQLLGLDPRFISLAEVPFFDDLLRLPFKTPDSPPAASLRDGQALPVRSAPACGNAAPPFRASAGNPAESYTAFSLFRWAPSAAPSDRTTCCP